MRPEILAPAGSMEALKAAVRAGADAVYLGGNRFGARAYANNFDESALIKAIEYCHLYGVKVYLTVNTLFHNEEIESLYEYLNPSYEVGLDAVIVQDFGVMKYIHEQFPDLEIHASTQMTITTKYAYSLLKEYGVKRIVPARELSIEEIASLKEDGNPEIEVFVQGALCYCYSGQCLMSSVLGGRSGNRGRCAQTCRLPYEVEERDNKMGSKDAYLLSPKDLCGLEAIPDLIKSGVDSFKIEGRMKKPEYVAVCVRAYRIALDAYYEGKFTKELVNQLKKEMADVFNRGGFTNGYYFKHNGKDMMSTKTPGNIGVRIGKITQINKNQITVKLEQEVSKGDLFLLENQKEEFPLTCNINAKPNEKISLNMPKGRTVHVGMDISRVHNALLQKEIEPYLTKDKDIIINGKAVFIEGTKATLTLSVDSFGKNIMVQVVGNMVETATKQPLSKEVIRDKITQTGNTHYVFSECYVETSEQVFYSLKEIKELRRNALERLEKEILRQRKRNVSEKQEINDTQDRRKDMYANSSKEAAVSAVVSNQEQYEAVLADGRIRRVYFDLQYFKIDELLALINTNSDYENYIMLPAILQKNSLEEVKEVVEYVISNKASQIGFVVRNIDELAYLKKCGYIGNIIADESLYIMNIVALQFVRSVFPQIEITAPVELNKKQLKELLFVYNGEVKVYGYQQLMVSAQCVQNTTRHCNHQNSKITLLDRYQKHFYVACICKYCYNLIYNGVPTVLYDVLGKEFDGFVRQRLHFTKESKEETRQIIHQFYEENVLSLEKTRGHYNRGVE